MPHKLRKQLRNHFVLGFIPFGGNIQDFIKPFIEEVKKLEQGFIINLNGIDHWVTGGLGVVTSDLPQGNDISGTLRHNAYRGCRICKATKDQFTNLLFDIYYHGHYHQITDQEFQYINQQTSKNAQSRLCSQYGLRPLPGPLDPILHDRHLHVPQNAYHAIAGKIARLLDCTCSILTLHGQNNLINYWKSFETPTTWSRLPNPITHRHSFMMSDNLRILMIFSFILKRCLTINSIKDDFLRSTCNRLRFSHRSEVCDYIIHTWVLSAKAAKELFPNSFQNLPNLLVSRHLVDSACQYATCINTAVGIKEMVHRIFKAIVPHTNKHNSNDITNPELFNCFEIKLGIRWNRNQIEAAGFISTNIETNGLFEDIMKAYSSYYSFEQALLETRVHFYENVSYTTLKPDGDYHNVKLKVGEIVEILRFGESEPTFGKIISIVEHSWNDNQEYVFLCFDWLENLNERNSLLDCPIYRIQYNSLDREFDVEFYTDKALEDYMNSAKAVIRKDFFKIAIFLMKWDEPMECFKLAIISSRIWNRKRRTQAFIWHKKSAGKKPLLE
ncbi:hypothetical protein C2G38_2239435 [Gigaspora rosea]|uniref:Uncharacterized protein n=1 Tax=Gigaspora rosea TaxID=44941 RepID=A0A397W4W2_9GLOM|nr:hypothetical protein C2G38_2239435 [Gigaspora rosea]